MNLESNELGTNINETESPESVNPPIHDGLVDKKSEIVSEIDSEDPIDDEEYLKVLKEVNKSLSELYEHITDRDQETSEKQSLENEENQIVEESNYVDQLNTLITNQESLQENLAVFTSGSQVVVTYGILYIPLMIITLSLYWFFKQFRDSY